MEHHILKNIQDRIKDSLHKIRDLQRTIKVVESREPVSLNIELIEGLDKVRINDILPLSSEFKNFLANKDLDIVDFLLRNIIFDIEKIEAVLRAIATRHIPKGSPNATLANNAIKEILDSSSSLISNLEKLYTFIDFHVEKNTIQLIKDRITRIKLFVLAIRQHAPSLIAGYKIINRDNIGDTEQWVIKLERFRLENIEPLKDKFDLFLSIKLSGELGEYIQKISDGIKAIEQIYKESPVGTERLEEKYEHEVNQHLDIIDYTINQMERFVDKYIE